MYIEGIESDELVELASRIPEVLCRSRAPNTLSTYKSHFSKWQKWAANYPEVVVMPANGNYIVLFMLSLLQLESSFSTIQQIFYAIKFYHQICNYLDPCNQLCYNILEAIKRILSKPVRKKLPITVAHLQNMCQSFGGNIIGKLENLRTMTIFFLSFAGFLRFSECIALRRSDLIISKTHAKIFIEQSKTDKYRQGHWLHIARINSELCPIKMLEEYLLRTKIKEGSEKFLFRGITSTRNGELLRECDKHVCYETIRKQVLLALKPFVADIKEYGLHSLRRGGATAAANLGIKDRLFQKHGRWKSEKIKDGYVEEDLNSLLLVSKKLGL